MTDRSDFLDRSAAGQEWDGHDGAPRPASLLRSAALLAARLASDGAVAVIAVLSVGALLGVGFQTALMFCLAGVLLAGAFAIASGA